MKLAVERTEGNCGHCLAVLRGSSKERKHMVLQSKAEIVDNKYSENPLTVRNSVCKEDEIERMNPFDRWVCIVISVNDGKSRSVKQERTLANV